MFNKFKKNRFARRFFAALAISVMSLGLSSSVVGDHKGTLKGDNIKKVQESLRDKGQYSGPINGVLGPKTRAALREYQKSENLKVTGQLDAETAGKLGAGPESVGGNFKGAGKEAKEGTVEAGHEMKEGKPVAAGKEMGKGVGRMGKKIGKGVKRAADPHSDRGDREEKHQEQKTK